MNNLFYYTLMQVILRVIFIAQFIKSKTHFYIILYSKQLKWYKGICIFPKNACDIIFGTVSNKYGCKKNSFLEFILSTREKGRNNTIVEDLL